MRRFRAFAQHSKPVSASCDYHLGLMYAVDRYMETAPDARLGIIAVALTLQWPSARGLSVSNIAGQLCVSAATITRACARFREMSGLGSYAGGVRFIQIALSRNPPALVGLQEVTLWRTGSLHLSATPPSATMVLFDQLNLLLADLANYTPVAVQSLTDVEVPVITGIGPAGPIGFDVRFTDQNVVLVRTDLMRQLALSNVQKHQFNNQSVLPTPAGNISILRGWISVDAHVQGNLLRFVTTHLETDADPVTQLKQANELVQALNSEDNPPVVLYGDFNADADTPNPTIEAILKGRFTDAWPTRHPLDPGFTIPLYIEDLSSPPPPPYTAISTPSHRIDLVFVRDSPRDANPTYREPSLSALAVRSRRGGGIRPN